MFWHNGGVTPSPHDASPRARERDLVVVSDLHLGRGFDPTTKRYHRLEAFFYDDDFRSFCGWMCRDVAERGAGLTLVLNGDVFDLLRIEPRPPVSTQPQQPVTGVSPVVVAR